MTHKELYTKWMNAWNGEINLLDTITSNECTVHQSRTDGRSSLEVKGPEALKGIIRDGLSLFDEARMTIEVGPIEEGEYVSARWNFSGKYNGKMPGAQAKAGTLMSFQGMDMFLIEEGKFREYWVSSDVLNLMEQLGVFES